MGASIVLVDVRTPEEFATGHLDGAINVEYQFITNLGREHGIHPDDNIVLYCRSGRRSGIALEMLKEAGFSQLRDLGSLEEARKTVVDEGLSVAPREKHRAAVGGQQRQVEMQASYTKLLDGLRTADGA